MTTGAAGTATIQARAFAEGTARIKARVEADSKEETTEIRFAKPGWSLTLSGSGDADENWSDPKHKIYSTGFDMRVFKNGKQVGTAWTLHYESDDLYFPKTVLPYKGLASTYPQSGDEIKLVFDSSMGSGSDHRVGPLHLHFYDGTTHEVISLGTVTALSYTQTPVTATLP